MRFINTSTLKHQYIADSEVQKLQNGYAILSHRWTEDEVTYKDIADPVGPVLEHKRGYAKFSGSCRLARSLNHELIWIDTCCIDKTDSVELGQAINSMYRWYDKSAVCIAYLEDVGDGQKALHHSRWFERGWTLQELIAPRRVEFYDYRWNIIGEKQDLVDQLWSRTGIPPDVLINKVTPRSCCIAQRMSWAAERKTTRVEDTAYCLMGLFDINMPFIYGEEEKAFIRLQEEIIKRNADQTIFAWDLDAPPDRVRRDLDAHPDRLGCGLFATSPAAFKQCGNLARTSGSESFKIGQFGLEIRLPCLSYSIETYAAILSVTEVRSDPSDDCKYAILLAKLSEPGQYARVHGMHGESGFWTGSKGHLMSRFTIPQEVLDGPRNLFPGFWLRHLEVSDTAQCDRRVLAREASPVEDRVVLREFSPHTVCIIKFSTNQARDYGRYIGWMKLGFDKDFRPMVLLLRPFSVASPHLRIDPLEFDDAWKAEAGTPYRNQHRVFHDSWLTYDARTGSHEFRRFTADWKAGLDIDVDYTFKFRLSIKLCPDLDPAATATSAPRKVWTVDIHPLEKRQPPAETKFCFCLPS